MKYKERLSRDLEGAVRVLSRVVCSTKFEYEADQRHAEILVRDVGLKEHSTGVTTPGVNDDGGAVDEGEVHETLYKAIAARANYLAQDRPDIHFAEKEKWAHLQTRGRRFQESHEAREMPQG